MVIRVALCEGRVTKTIRVTVSQDQHGRWVLFMTDQDKIPDSSEPVALYPEDIEGSVCLNKSISMYLRHILAMIEDELPE